MMYDPSTLGIMPIKPRFATQEIQNLLTHFPVVALHGAPQVGKSVIARDLADRTGGIFVDLDDPDPYAFAYQEPAAFIRQAPGKLLVIDSIHYVPELLDHICGLVEFGGWDGRFLVVDSAGCGIDHDTADIGHVTVHPLSQGEIDEHATPEDFITWIIARPPVEYPPRSYMNRQAVTLRVTRGGMPMALGCATTKSQARWCRNYTRNLCARLRNDVLRRVVALLATTPVTEIVQARLSRELGITEREARVAMMTLRAAGVIIDLPGWHSAANKRSVSAAKSLLLDTGLTAQNVGFSAGEIDIPRSRTYFRQLLEQFVVQQLVTQQTWSATSFRLRHFRTRDGATVGVVVELVDGRVVLIDVTTNTQPAIEDFATMERLRQALGDQVIAGVILHTGMHSRRYRDWQYLLPITTLWEHR